jgi:hypothetical protein
LTLWWSAASGRQRSDDPLDGDASSEFASIAFFDRRDTAGWGAAPRDAYPTWLFARVPEAETVKNRMHLDVASEP